MKECLFDVSNNFKNFGIDANGLLTCSEKEFIKTKNPYVNIAPAYKEDFVQAKCNIPNSILEEIHQEPWYIEACNKGILNADKYSDSRDSSIYLGVFAKEDILKAAYIAQTIRFSENNEIYLTTLLKAVAEGKLEVVRNQIIDEVLKDMPKFEHPALQAFDPESYTRMKQAVYNKYKDYIQAFNRRFNNVYTKVKAKDFDAATDKLKLLTVMDEKRLAFLEEEAKVLRVKKRGAFDVNAFILKALQKNDLSK